MKHTIIVPAGAPASIPQGAAVIAAGRGSLLVHADPREPFGELCARALLRGRRVPAAQAAFAAEVGWFDDEDREVTLSRRGRAALETWLGLGRMIGHTDLRARRSRPERRSQARQLADEGRLLEAYELDGTLGF